MSLETKTNTSIITKIDSTPYKPKQYIYTGIEIIFIIFGFWRMLKTFPLLYFYDGNMRFSAIQELFQGKISTVSYSLVGPLFSLPLWLIQNWHLASWLNPQKYNVFLLMAFMLAVYVAFRKRINPSLLRKFFLILIIASMFSNQVQFYGGETFTATFVAFGALAITFSPVWLGWIAIVLGVVNTPAALVGLLCLSLKKIWDDKRLRYGL